MHIIKAKNQDVFVGRKHAYHKAQLVNDINNARTFITKGAAKIALNSQNTAWALKDEGLNVEDFEIRETILTLK